MVLTSWYSVGGLRPVRGSRSYSHPPQPKGLWLSTGKQTSSCCIYHFWHFIYSVPNIRFNSLSTEIQRTVCAETRRNEPIGTPNYVFPKIKSKKKNTKLTTSCSCLEEGRQIRFWVFELTIRSAKKKQKRRKSLPILFLPVLLPLLPNARFACTGTTAQSMQYIWQTDTNDLPSQGPRYSKVAAWASDWFFPDKEVRQGTVRSWAQP